MKRFSFVLIVSLAFSSTSLAVELIREPIINGPYIRLGNLFKGIEDQAKADRRLSVAPQPGKKITLSAQLLEKIANANKLKWKAKSHLDYAVVTAAFESLGYQDVLAAVRTALEKQMMEKNFKIDLKQKDIKIYFPAGQIGDIEIDHLQLGRNRTTFSARVKKIENGQPRAAYRIQGKITPMVSVPALRRIVKQGEIIKISDIHWIDVPTHYIQAQTLTQETDLIGTTARQGTLRENIPLKKSDIYRPLTITKGEMVTLHAKTDFMCLTTKGKALENGIMGEAIKILNVSSNRTIHATVVGPKMAEVDVSTIQTLG